MTGSGPATPGPVRFEEKFELIEDLWSPRVIAEMNDYQFKLVRIEGEFVWHHHADTDEVFIVLAGQMVIHLRDRNVALQEGDMFVVPRGEKHKPSADQECRVLLIEPQGVFNTGEEGGERTAEPDLWV